MAGFVAPVVLGDVVRGGAVFDGIVRAGVVVAAVRLALHEDAAVVVGCTALDRCGRVGSCCTPWPAVAFDAPHAASSVSTVAAAAVRATAGRGPRVLEPGASNVVASFVGERSVTER